MIEARQSRLSRWVRRAPMLGLVLFLVGPAPGEVGACGQAEGKLDFEQYCLDLSAYECARMEARGEFPGRYADLADCRQAAFGICDGGAWPTDCQPYPTKPEGQACIDQLARASNVRISITDIPECDVCP